MGDSERVMFNDAFSKIGVGGGTLVEVINDC